MYKLWLSALYKYILAYLQYATTTSGFKLQAKQRQKQRSRDDSLQAHIDHNMHT